MMPDEISAGERVESHAMKGCGYLSPWMAHWKHTGYKSATSSAYNCLSVGCEVKKVKENSDVEQDDLLFGPEVGSGSSMHARVVGDEVRARSVGFVDEGETGKSKKASFGSKSFLISRLSQDLNGRSPFKREEKSAFREEDGKFGTKSSSGDYNVSLNRVGGYLLPFTFEQATLPKIETSVKECELLSQEMPVKSPCTTELKNPTLSTSVQNNVVRSTSDIVPTYERDKGKSVMVISEPHKVYPSSHNSASQEHYANTKYHSQASLCVREKQMSSSLLDRQRSSLSTLMRDSFACFPHDPISDSDDDRLYVVRSQQRKILNLIANPDSTNHSPLLESTKPQNFYGVNSSVARVPQSVYDVKTAKICTSIDSVEELSRGHPNVSQTTHRFLTSRNTDVSLSDRGQFVRESIAPMKFKGNNFNEIFVLSPTLGSSRKSERKENIHDFKCPTSLMNESSLVPDTMDIDTLHESNLSGEVPLQVNKCSKDSQNSLSSQGATISARGKNIEMETSTSKTRSLDMEQLFYLSKSGSSSLGSDPSSRWVKRLKLCTLDSDHGTKSENIGETSHVKLTNIFNKIMKDSKTNLEADKAYHSEGPSVPDPPPTILSNDESSFTEAKETVEVTLSHPWIQRWGHNQAAFSKKRCESAEIREPKSSNSAPKELKNKQFPSIAAMALMGKTMNYLNPPELTKKGPVIVWNTNGH